MKPVKQRKDFADYQKALDLYLSGDHTKLKKQMLKLDLSKQERTLIEARLLLKDNKIQQAQELLLKLNTSHNFHEAERQLVLANSYGFESNWQLATLHNLRAYEIYAKLEDRRGLFITSYNVAVDFSHMGHKALAQSYYEQSFKIASSTQEQVLVLRALALDLQSENKTDQAKQEIEKALALAKDTSSADQVSTWLVAADLYWQWDEKERSYEFLVKAEKNRNVLDGPRLEFEKQIASWCLGKSKKLSFSFALLDSTEYGLYAKLFSYLQNGDVNLAQATWYQLSKKYPEKFSPEFLLLQNSEQSSLLGSAVEKWKRSTQNTQPAHHAHLTNTELKLFSILQQQQTPANKEWLIEKVWDKSFEPADIAKFYKLIERLRKKQIHITKNSTGYFIK